MPRFTSTLEHRLWTWAALILLAIYTTLESAGTIAAYLWAAFRIVPAPEERTHLIEYSLVAVLIFRALLERQRNGEHIPRPAVVAFGVTTLLGWLDEGVQFLLPNRIFDWRDVLFNLLAAGMGVGAELALSWARRWQKKRTRQTEIVSHPPADSPPTSN